MIELKKLKYVTFTYSLKSFPLHFSEIQFGKAIALLQCPILSNWMALFSKGLEKVIKRLSFLALKATLWPELPIFFQKIFCRFLLWRDQFMVCKWKLHIFLLHLTKTGTCRLKDIFMESSHNSWICSLWICLQDKRIISFWVVNLTEKLKLFLTF